MPKTQINIFLSLRLKWSITPLLKKLRYKLSVNMVRLYAVVRLILAYSAMLLSAWVAE